MCYHLEKLWQCGCTDFMGKLPCCQALDTGYKGCKQRWYRTDWSPSCCPDCKHEAASKTVGYEVIRLSTAMANATAVMALLDHLDSKGQYRKIGGFLELYR